MVVVYWSGVSIVSIWIVRARNESCGKCPDQRLCKAKGWRMHVLVEDMLRGQEIDGARK